MKRIAALLGVSAMLLIGGFVIFRGELPASLQEVIAPPFQAEFEHRTLETNTDTPITRTWLLPREAQLPHGFVLLLTGQATSDGPLIITDPVALRAAQNTAYVDHKTMDTGQSVMVTIFSLGTALAKYSTLATIGWDGELREEFSCWWCAASDEAAHGRDFAGLIEAGRPAEKTKTEFDDEDLFLAARSKAVKAPDTWVSKRATFWASKSETNKAHGRLTTWRIIKP